MAAGAGDLDRARVLAGQAETAAQATTNRFWQADVLARLAEVAAGAGDLDRAEALAQALTDSGRQAQTLIALARNIEPIYARSLIARALTLSSWETSIGDLREVDPAAAITTANEYLASITSRADIP